MSEHLSIVDAVRRAGDSFEEGELAFLSLTSKVERPFVDRVAFQLHRGTCGGPRSGRRTLSSDIVAREYTIIVPGGKRVAADIAVLRGGRVRLILEAKAMSGGASGAGYLQELQKDLNRYAVSHIDSSIYCLLIATRLLERPPATLPPGVIKYLKLGERPLPNASDLSDRLGRSLSNPDLQLATDRISSGVAFKVPVELCWWLYGPFRPPGPLKICR